MSDLESTTNVWVTRDEAMVLTGLSRASLYRRIAEESWRTRPSAANCENGRPILEVAVSSLPKAAQALYWAKHLVPDPEPSADPLNLAEIPEALRTEARRRLTLLDQARELQDGPSSLRADALAQFCRDHDLSPRSLYRWQALYEQRGLAALLPKWGKTRGQFLALSTPIQSFIKDQYCSPQRPSPTTVYRHVVTLCSHLHEPVPSQATVNRFLLTLPPPAVVLAREGPKAFRSKMEPKCHRDLSALAPNEVWCGDHRVFDVMVRTHDGDSAKVCRPWMTAWYDLGTRTCVGMHVGLVPNSDTIALALRAGILRFGIPQELYIDNGKDYRSHYLNGQQTVSRNVSLSPEITDTLAPGVLSPLGVTVRHATPYQPWSKPIEPWFGHTFPEWEQTLPGWCGRNAHEKPEKLKGEIQRGELLTLAEFSERLAERIESYHHTEHSVLGSTPLAAWRESTIVRPNPRTLDLLLMRQRAAKVTHQGIKAFGRYYWHDELSMQIGCTVEVRYDPRELGKVLVFKDRALLCEAVNDPALRMGASHEDLAALHRRKKLARQRAQAALDDRGVLMNPDRELARISAAANARKVVPLDLPPTPAGVRAIPKMLPQLDQAAALVASSASAAARTPAHPPAVPPVSSSGGRRSDRARSRVSAGSGPAAGAAAADATKDRYALLEELLG